MATDSVGSCRACGSLAMRCPERACRSWNRAFVRWCRHCGRDLRGSSDVWEGLRTANPPEGPTAIGPAEIVAELSELDGPTKSRRHRVAIAAVEGFLALHQAGGFVALIRPFSRSGKGLAFNLREPESPSAAGAAYAPTILPGGRYLLLADRRCASVIDLWDTAISAAAPSGRGPRRLSPPSPIARAPIALSESKVGLVVGASAPYSWLVWDLAERDPTPSAAKVGMRPIPSIRGGPCEAELVDGKTLTFATPEGHWAWRIQDAAAGRVEAIRETWRPEDGAGAVGIRAAIDRRAENPEAFANPSQAFLANASGGPFYWHFRTTDGRARSYRVSPSDLTTDDRSDFDGISPVGLAVRPGKRRPSMIFDKNDMLFEESDIRGKLAPCQVSLPGEGPRRPPARGHADRDHRQWPGRLPLQADRDPGALGGPVPHPYRGYPRPVLRPLRLVGPHVHRREARGGPPDPGPPGPDRR